MFVAKFSHTQAGIERRAQQRGVSLPAIEAPKPKPAPVATPEASNVVRLVIPRTEAQQIIADVAHKHGLTYADLMSKRRFRHIVPARDEAMAAVKAMSNGDKWSFSLPMIARLFGGRDHTSVLAALRRHAKREASS